MKNQLAVSVRNGPSRHCASNEDGGGADAKLMELVRLRVAQIHQNPIAIAMHLDELRAKGETEERLQHLAAWATSELFCGQERAALALSEKISSDPVHSLPDYLIQEMRHNFTREAIVNLTLAIITVNDWHFVDGH